MKRQIQAVRFRKIAGLQMWEMEPDGAIAPAHFEEMKLVSGKYGIKTIHRLKVRENHKYRQALNAKNALRKFLKVNPDAYLKTLKK